MSTFLLAYIDPGVGSLIFQGLIGGAIASFFVLRQFWGRILGAFRRSPPPSKTDLPPAA